MNKVGTRIKYFRKRAELTQSDLELAINAATGSISRTESGQVSPAKQTLQKISEVLDLTPKEYQYLAGAIVDPVSQSEIDAACKEVREYFKQKNVIGYILDDRWRVWDISKTFQRILNIADEMLVDLRGKTLMGILLDTEIGILDLFQKEKLKDTLYYQFSRYYREIYFMKDEPIFEEVMRRIESNQMAKEVWDRVLLDKGIHDPSLESRTIHFNFKGINITLNYSREPLQSNPRFEMIEYVPTNKLIRLFSGLFM